MKSSYTAFGAVLLALAGLWYVGGGSGAPAQSAAAAEQTHVSAPLSHSNLTVFFIHGPDTVTDTHKVATLQEALEAGWAIVHETGNVNMLAVENRSDDYELFIQEGDMIKGGQQDRVFAVDMLVPPKSGRVPFPAHCVEAGRWTKRGNESAVEFNKSDNFAVGKSLRYANATQQQGEVWKNVKDNQDKLSAQLGTKVNADVSESSFQLTLENKDLQAKVAEFEKALRSAGESRKNVVGVVFLVNGQVTGAEVYGSNALFQKVWPKLLRSQATDAVAEKTDKVLPAIPSTQEVERFLAMAGQQPAATEPRSRQYGRGSHMFLAENDLTNADPGFQSNLEAALPEVDRVGRVVIEGHAQTGDRIQQAAQQAQAGVSGGTYQNTRTEENRQRIRNFYGVRGQQVQTAANANPTQNVEDNIILGGTGQGRVTQTTASASPVNPTGNRLNVQRVEDKSGLCSESRDPARQNALIHKSFIKK